MQASRRTFLKAAVPVLTVILPAEADLQSIPDYEDVFSDLRLTDKKDLESKKALESIVADREFILREAETADLPPEFLASVIYDQRRDETWLSGLTDRILSIVRDQSMGEGQIRPSVAALTDGLKE